MRQPQFINQAQLLKYTEGNSHTVQLWVRDGLLHASVQDAIGRGGVRLYGPPDLTVCSVILKLTKLGFGRRFIKKITDGMYAENISASGLSSSQHDTVATLRREGFSLTHIFFNPFSLHISPLYLVLSGDSFFLSAKLPKEHNALFPSSKKGHQEQIAVIVDVTQVMQEIVSRGK